jgi:serine/threonine-protein kinase
VIAASIALIALCEANLGRTAAAEGHAAEAVALAPDDHNVLLRAAKVGARVGNTAAALDRIRRAVAHGLSPEVARRDPELASLQRLPEFVAATAGGARDKGGSR